MSLPPLLPSPAPRRAPQALSPPSAPRRAPPCSPAKPPRRAPFPGSWPSSPASLPRQGPPRRGGRAPPPAAPSSPPPPPPPPPFSAGRFSLSLPPEAIRVLQRRSLEEENEEKQRRRHKQRRPRGGGSGGVGKSGPEWRHLLPVSLLNERHRYDDVEYEEEGAGEGEEGAAGSRTPARDEGLVRKCTEWLRGVERASARDRAGKLGSLPHLGTL
ncbi:proline-rich protein 18 [Anolis carolinensis]|uniref:proline-rich protein 18 n=1 Tax=Anolis carolinensis TaxID=28377 RepID=UPI002F2B7319